MFSTLAHVLGDCCPLHEIFILANGNTNYNICLGSVISHDLYLLISGLRDVLVGLIAGVVLIY